MYSVPYCSQDYMYVEGKSMVWFPWCCTSCETLHVRMCFRPAEKEPAQARGGHGACSCPGLEGHEAASELSARGTACRSALLILVLVAARVGQRHRSLWRRWGGHRCPTPHGHPAYVGPAPWRTAGPVPTVWGSPQLPVPLEGFSWVMQQWWLSVLWKQHVHN